MIGLLTFSNLKKRRLKIRIYSSQFSNVTQIDLRPFQVEGIIKVFDIFMTKTYKVIYFEKMRQIHNSSLYRKRNRSWHRTALRQSSYFTLQVLCCVRISPQSEENFLPTQTLAYFFHTDSMMRLITIQIFFLIWISRSFKKVASDNTITYFDQSFRFSGLWIILAIDLGRSGQNKSWGTENRKRTNNSFFF